MHKHLLAMVVGLIGFHAAAAVTRLFVLLIIFNIHCCAMLVFCLLLLQLEICSLIVCLIALSRFIVRSPHQRGRSKEQLRREECKICYSKLYAQRSKEVTSEI